MPSEVTACGYINPGVNHPCLVSVKVCPQGYEPAYEVTIGPEYNSGFDYPLRINVSVDSIGLFPMVSSSLARGRRR